MATNVNVIELFQQAALEVDNRKLTNLSKDTVIAQLGMDSVAIMELVSVLEERLKLRIPDEELGRVRTIGDLRDCIARHAAPGTQVSA
jgi:acyl carrier protein